MEVRTGAALFVFAGAGARRGLVGESISLLEPFLRILVRELGSPAGAAH